MRLVALLVASALSWSTMGQAQDGTDASPFAGMDAYVREALKTWEVPGLAIAVVKDGTLVLARGYGVRALGDDSTVTPDTVFPIASCTKSFVATCVALLVEEGKLDWDDPVVTRLPGFELADATRTRQVTLRDLLCHRTGLRRCDPLVERGDFGPADILSRLKHLPIDAPLRTRLTYSNPMFTALGAIVERTAEQPWQQLVTERVLRPLSMESTTFDLSRIPAGRRTRRHWRSDLGIVARPGEVVDDGVHSTVRDLAHWLRLQLAEGQINGHRLLQPKTIQEMHAQQFAVPIRSRPNDNVYAARFYGSGLGWFVQEYRGRKIVLHGGSWGAIVAMIPEEQLGVVVLSNLDLESVPALLMFDVFDAYLVGPKNTWASEKWATTWLRHEPPGNAYRARDAARERLEKERRPGTRPTRSLAEFAGIYESPLYGPLVVREADSRLTMTFGRFTTEMAHWQDDEFLVRAPTRLTYDWLLMFEVDAQSRVDEVVVRHVGWDASEGDQRYRRVE